MKKLLVGLLVLGSIASNASMVNNISKADDIKKALKLYFATHSIDCSIVMNTYGSSVRPTQVQELVQMLGSSSSTLRVSSPQSKIILERITGYPDKKQNIIEFTLDGKGKDILNVKHVVKDIISNEINHGTIVNPNFRAESKSKIGFVESCDVVENY